MTKKKPQVSPKREQGILATQGRPKRGIPPQKQKALEAYTNMAMTMIHGKEGKDKVREMLKSGPAEVSVPNSVLTINQFLEQSINAEKGKVQKDVVMAATTPIVADLIDIGNGEGYFQVEAEEAQAILKDTVQQYIETSVKNGSMDPIKLQGQMQPLANKEQVQAGLTGIEQGRIPPVPTRAMEDQRIQKNAIIEDRKTRGVLG